MIIIRMQKDPLYFTVTAECGCVWIGMRHTDDVQIIVNRAMDHGRCDEPTTHYAVTKIILPANST